MGRINIHSSRPHQHHHPAHSSLTHHPLHRAIPLAGDAQSAQLAPVEPSAGFLPTREKSPFRLRVAGPLRSSLRQRGLGTQLKMSSSCLPFLQNLPSHLPQQTPAFYSTNDYDYYLPTPQSSIASTTDLPLIDDTTLAHLESALQQQQVRRASSQCMNEQQEQFATTHPNIRIQSSSPLPPPVHGGRQDSAFAGPSLDGQDWQRMYGMSMGGGPVQRPLKRARSHQRTPSASTVGSNGPASPYTANTFNPRIANTDYAPNSPAHLTDQAPFSKGTSAPQQAPTGNAFWNSGYYVPSQAANSNAHWAMKGFAIDHHNTDDFPEFYASPMSSHGNNTPTTPQSGMGDGSDPKPYSQSDIRQMNGNPASLFRTESSQAYQDELYNPPTTYTSTPAVAQRRPNEFLTPHRNLITERLQTAEAARSASPQSAMSRERSPFRDGSPLAPAGDWNASHLGTAASMRQQRKQEAEQAEMEAHQPTLRREQTKTMSPQDALLDYNESEQQAPLFQDSAPIGYKQHNGGMETWQSNFAGSTFGNLTAFPSTQQPQMTPFRATSADTDFSAYNSMPLPPTTQDQGQIHGASYPAQNYAAPKMNFSDLNTNPEFPAHLTSMDSSVSDNAPPASSQDSFNRPSAPKRPTDTRANTGTYTCTYHGCSQRFDSHTNLQRHKRDYHRSQQQQHQQQRESETPGDEESASAPSASASASARSTESPAPSGNGMTSAAILARNSQAGPHKCTRINPSTNKPCNTIFSRPYDLTRHEDTIHNNRKQKVKCPMCREEKTFSRNDALTRHMRVVHPEVESFGKRGGRH